MSVRMSATFRGNAIFSVPIKDRGLIFPVHILPYISIYSINILSVGQATKGKDVKPWKCDFLYPIPIFCNSSIYFLKFQTASLLMDVAVLVIKYNLIKG